MREHRTMVRPCAPENLEIPGLVLAHHPGMTPVTLSRNARPDRAGHAGAAEPAIAGRILRQILLMIVLGEIERTGGGDLGGDGAEPLGRQRLLIGRLRSIGRLALRIVRGVDRAAILRADIVALTHALCRVMAFPERLE